VTAAFAAELAFAHELADLADAISLPAFRQRLEVETKADGTPVTEVDRGVERRLRAAIAERFPDHAILGEEDGRQGPADAPTWIIDPIDGTRSFVTGNPVWATLIALSDAGGERVGVVSAPALGRRWDGVRGGPAHADGRPIRVSGVGRLSDGQVTVGDLTSFGQRGDADAIDRLVAGTVRQRGYGDFYGFCFVAEGSMEAAVEALASQWDFAAVKCLVEAAGGRFTSFEGEATAAGGSGVATNGLVHDEVLSVLRP
jgi:histidinol-phosphatase